MAVSLKRWNRSPKSTQDMIIRTKMLDFDNISDLKKISRITLSYISEGATDFVLTASYRTNPTDNFTLLGGESSSNLTANTSGVTILTINPIITCKQFQLEINISVGSDSLFGLNDISITHRILRDYSVKSESEN